ncbi:MAG TPA: hypothetical protein VMD59_06585 [Acidimicrobiales bacterium]|nr:hypothetical protein [Acidimicrobiales bacterium]
MGTQDHMGTQDRETGAAAYESEAAAARLPELIEAAVAGRPVQIRHDGSLAAVVDAERLRRLLAGQLVRRATLAAEAGGWTVFVPGTPVGVAADTYDQAVDEMVEALWDYSRHWQERLLTAVNHRDNWGLVQLVSLSSDGQLRSWLGGEQP